MSFNWSLLIDSNWFGLPLCEDCQLLKNCSTTIRATMTNFHTVWPVSENFLLLTTGTEVNGRLGSISAGIPTLHFRPVNGHQNLNLDAGPIFCRSTLNNRGGYGFLIWGLPPPSKETVPYRSAKNKVSPATEIVNHQPPAHQAVRGAISTVPAPRRLQVRSRRRVLLRFHSLPKSDSRRV